MDINNHQLLEAGHEYVDLGLSVMWATCNVGSEGLEDFGDFFAWGEIESRESFNEDSYKWYDDTYYLSHKQRNISHGLIKYCIHSACGFYCFTDNLKTLVPNDDVSHVKWGGKWQIPSVEDWRELIDNCTWVWTKKELMCGYVVTSNKSGYTDRSIFLPIVKDIRLYKPDLLCGYWTNNLHPDDSNAAKCILFDSKQVYESKILRYSGLAVRPVVPRQHEYVDLGLSVKWATCNVGAAKPEETGDYFAWGETVTKNHYLDLNYKWYDGSEVSITKYCNNKEYGRNGFTDDKMMLDSDDDVAHFKWGESWRMPTKAEQYELLTECSWVEETLNGVKGYRITSNKDGFTDKSIFLPAAGFQIGSELHTRGYLGAYWSSLLDYENKPSSAWCVKFLIPDVDEVPTTDIIWPESDSRDKGSSVRPVCP